MSRAQERLLIIKHGALGDIILCTGQIKAIRAQHLSAYITCLTSPAFKSFFSACPWIDEVLTDEKPSWKQPRRLIDFIRRLRQQKFDWVYDLQTSLRSSLYWWIFSYPKPRFCGIALFASHRYRSQDRHQLHAIEQINQQLRIAGIQTEGMPDISWMNADISTCELPAHYMLIIAGGSAHRLEKRWPLEHYAALAKHMIDCALVPVLIGSYLEAETLSLIANKATGCLNLCGKTDLFMLASIARSARFAVGNDTGPTHLIAATGCHTTVLFSRASKPKKSAPIGAHVQTLQSDDLSQLSVETVMQTLASRLQ